MRTEQVSLLLTDQPVTAAPARQLWFENESIVDKK